jgi:hypothetical protein
MSPDELGRTAYAAYGAITDFKNFRGEPMPLWDELPTTIRRAWAAAGQAAAEAMFHASKQPSVRLVDPGDVKVCTHCSYIWPPGRMYGRCPGCQQIYEG